MSMAEKIRILLIKKGNISEAELARRLNKSPQSFNSSMKRDNFTEKDLQEIAKSGKVENPYRYLGLRREEK